MRVSNLSTNSPYQRNKKCMETCLENLRVDNSNVSNVSNDRVWLTCPFFPVNRHKQWPPFGAKKCSNIFVCVHYLFREGNSFPRAQRDGNVLGRRNK